MKVLFSVKDVTKTFTLSKKQRKILKTNDSKKVAVKSLSFDAYEGEIYGLLGPNGAGKTTTLRIASSLIKPDSGDVFIDGISVVNDPSNVRRKIGFLTSELKLEDFFTPNYLFDYFSRLHNIEEETIQARKKMLFDQFGIQPFCEVKVSDLSTGMKQKVSLAISIAHDPSIIIFDEPTNGLDIITAKTVTDFLIHLKQTGKTIILSTHIFSLVEKLCDRVGIIIEGEMVYENTVAEIMKTTDLETLFFQLYESKGGVL
ncbi:ATP-binding cassette domain-containing protein [Acholeplasma vituli]|uniref:ATP-binding cassette domain-containing protein n=1 Tax=Paracholeplasma vituli TaxID=69473 RepID=A0ABT2PV04_9MOLU|nr:ATP-binding cassette domain-containing protein [Paracholeplasma vituli]MCU0104786.1 ATP-binding cassette domain-containing protein [Paracholeplasma vituli]